MKTKAKIVLLAIFIFSLPSFHACDEGCPGQEFDTYNDCEDATDRAECECVPDGDGWIAVPNI